MPAYLISYDLHRVREYSALLKQLRDWSCHPMHKSTWLGVLKGPASAVRDILKAHVDPDDSIAVIELKVGSEWALTAVNQQDMRSGDWLATNVTPRTKG